MKEPCLPSIPSLRLRLTLALALACLGSSARAEEAPPDLPGQMQLAQLDLERQIVFGDGAGFAAMGELGPERVVKGAPYCADAVHETVQWLADGSGGAPNRIVRQQSTRLCRDAEGRTRQELDRAGRKLVVLRDPVSHENWILDPERKSARRLADGRAGGVDASLWQDYAERMREFARSTAERARQGATGSTPPRPPTPPTMPTPPTPPTATTPPTPVIITAPEGGPGGERRVEMRVYRGGAEGAPAMEWPVPPTAVQWRAQSLAPRGAGTVTPLAGRDIDGVRANGERTTWVIEAGRVGNEKPIQITREVWTSPELMVTLASRDFDPRSGEVNYRLKNLKRGEPDAGLLRVPADFTRPARPAAGASGPAG